MSTTRTPQPNSTRRSFVLGGLAAIAGVAASQVIKLSDKVPWTGTRKKLIRIGFADVAYAIAPDHVVDGSDDHLTWNTALGQLPGTGGKIISYGGNQDFGDTVDMPCNNIVIEGSGKATYIANNASTPLFDLNGKTGIIFKDIRLDAGGITGTFSVASGNLRKNVWIGDTYYNDPSVATDTIFDAAGDIPVGTGADTAVARNLLSINTIGDLGATPTIAFNTKTQQQGTVNVNITALTCTDPGYACFCRLELTKSDDAVERTIAWAAPFNSANNWVNSDPLLTMGTTAKKRYVVWVWRKSSSSDVLAGYLDGGVG